jgi:hypothetical protein
MRSWESVRRHDDRQRGIARPRGRLERTGGDCIDRRSGGRGEDSGPQSGQRIDRGRRGCSQLVRGSGGPGLSPRSRLSAGAPALKMMRRRAVLNPGGQPEPELAGEPEGRAPARWRGLRRPGATPGEVDPSRVATSFRLIGRTLLCFRRSEQLDPDDDRRLRSRAFGYWFEARARSSIGPSRAGSIGRRRSREPGPRGIGRSGRVRPAAWIRRPLPRGRRAARGATGRRTGSARRTGPRPRGPPPTCASG